MRMAWTASGIANSETTSRDDKFAQRDISYKQVKERRNIGMLLVTYECE